MKFGNHTLITGDTAIDGADIIFNSFRRRLWYEPIPDPLPVPKCPEKLLIEDTVDAHRVIMDRAGKWAVVMGAKKGPPTPMKMSMKVFMKSDFIDDSTNADG